MAGHHEHEDEPDQCKMLVWYGHWNFQSMHELRGLQQPRELQKSQHSEHLDTFQFCKAATASTNRQADQVKGNQGRDVQEEPRLQVLL